MRALLVKARAVDAEGHRLLGFTKCYVPGDGRVQLGQLASAHGPAGERGNAKKLAAKLGKDEAYVSRLRGLLRRGHRPRDPVLIGIISGHAGIDPPFRLPGDAFEERVINSMRRMRAVGLDDRWMEFLALRLEGLAAQLVDARTRKLHAEQQERMAWHLLDGMPLSRGPDGDKKDVEDK